MGKFAKPAPAPAEEAAADAAMAEADEELEVRTGGGRRQTGGGPAALCILSEEGGVGPTPLSGGWRPSLRGKDPVFVRVAPEWRGGGSKALLERGEESVGDPASSLAPSLSHTSLRAA